MRNKWVAVLIAATLVAGAACGGEDDALQADGGETAPATQAVTTAAVEPTVSVPAGFPREVPMSQVPEVMRLTLINAGGREEVAVEVAPGIYAARGSGEIGEASDYTSVVGLCADVRQFERVNGFQGGSSCW